MQIVSFTAYDQQRLLGDEWYRLTEGIQKTLQETEAATKAVEESEEVPEL